jgi:hypothetical protein
MAQPELSNEVLPPDSDFVVCGAGGVGVGCVLAGAGLTGVGGGVDGAETDAAGVVAAASGLLGAAEVSTGCDAGLVAGAALGGVERLG